MSMPLVAKGIRVVEVSDFYFVPLAGGVLACWGADVIKIEHHERGDAMRGVRNQAPGFLESRPTVGVGQVNRGKRSIGVNLASDEGREVLYALVREADVFITNRMNPTIRKLRFGPEEIRAQNPNIIYARGTAHGSRGPEADSGGFDASDYWYRGGIAAGLHMPDAEMPPYIPSPGFGDSTTGFHLAGGIMSALFHRERTGEALNVEASLLAAGLWSMGAAIAISSKSGEPVKQNPHGMARNPLDDIYRTEDGGLINIGCLQGFRYFAEFCYVLGLDEVANDERFGTQEGFQEHADELSKIFAATIGGFTFDEFIERLKPFSGQWAAVNDACTVASDVQVMANGYLADMNDDPANVMKDVTPPVQFNGRPAELLQPPIFNEHGDEILKELGMSEDEIINLKIAGAVT
jgi:crotonobetainyl-CoA:carnitine CoA-transferase CaiB-like acyl-CoA transferase